jgi:hypothetical protein
LWEALVGVLQEFGPVGFLVALGLAVLALLARLYAGRKRLVWEEELNTKIGMEPFGSHHHSTPDLTLFNSITVLVIKFRNAGWSTVNDADYRTWPQVAVSGRFIVDFRVSEPSHRTLAQDIRRAARRRRRGTHRVGRQRGRARSGRSPERRSDPGRAAPDPAAVPLRRRRRRTRSHGT